MNKLQLWYREFIKRQYEKLFNENYLIDTGKSITLNEIAKLLEPLEAQVYFSDEGYMLTTKKSIKDFIWRTGIPREKYVKQRHDCENFAFELMGKFAKFSIPFGFVRSKTHAFNITIDDKKKVWLVEPQTNGFISLETFLKSKNNDRYKLYKNIQVILI